MNDLACDPRFTAGVPTSSLSPDAAYIRLVLPTPGVMRAGRLVDDDDALPPTAQPMKKDWTGTSE